MPHADILDQQERLRNPFAFSLVLHAALFALIGGAGYIGSPVEQWGDPNSLGGGSVGITPVARIPLPPRAGLRNPVANDTPSTIPAPPKPEPKARELPDPDAIAIKSRNARVRPQPSPGSQQKYRPDMVERRSQVYSSTGQAAVSQLYSMAPGGGGIGSGSQNPFGQGFGWYAQLIREKVARNWNTAQVDPRLRTAPDLVIVFELHRDGSTRGVRVAQSSGNYALDQSAMRAVAQASPFQAFPPNMPRDMYTIDLVFRLSR